MSRLHRRDYAHPRAARQLSQTLQRLEMRLRQEREHGDPQALQAALHLRKMTEAGHRRGPATRSGLPPYGGRQILEEHLGHPDRQLRLELPREEVELRHAALYEQHLGGPPERGDPEAGQAHDAHGHVVGRQAERRLEGLGIPVLALLAEAHLETLQRLAQLPRGARVGVIAAAVETTHTLEHSIAAAALPNIARIETCPAEGPALKRLVRRVSVIVCSSSTARQVQGLLDPAVPVIIDDRALNQRAIQMLGTVLAQRDGAPSAPSSLARERPGRRPFKASSRHRPSSGKASRQPDVTRVSPTGGTG